jgi:hypothetical protein
VLWSYPRETSAPAYQAFGFSPCSDWRHDPDTPAERHCYMRLDLV